MASYHELMKLAQTKRLGKPLDTSPSVTDPDHERMVKLTNAMELADIASNLIPAKGAVAGLGGIIRGSKALNWDKAGAKSALDFLNAGIPRRQTYHATVGEGHSGTYLGPEGFLRQEISDYPAAIRGDLQKKLGKDSMGGPQIRAPLIDVMEHPDLFKGYPQLANMPVTIEPRTGTSAAVYLPDSKEIKIYPSLPEDVRQGKVPKEDLLHEIQHVVQDIEGFAKGGSPAYYRKTLEAMERTGGKNRDPLQSVYGPATGRTAKSLKQEISVRGRDPDKAYQELYGEGEARLVEARMNMNRAAKDRYAPHEMWDTDRATHLDPFTKKWAALLRGEL